MDIQGENRDALGLKPDAGDFPFRADAWLRTRFPLLTRRQIKEALELGLVVSKSGRRLKAGSYCMPEDFPLNCGSLRDQIENLTVGNVAAEGATIDIPIQMESEVLAVVDKPVGIHCHGLKLLDSNTVANWALSRWPNMVHEFGRKLHAEVTPHRLDRDTSGVLLVTKTDAAFHTWRQRFNQKEVEKTYLAWCWGSPNEDAYSVELILGHIRGSQHRMGVLRHESKVTTPYLETKSDVEVLVLRPDRFLARVKCKTGVTHQVRVHMGFLGYPLLGDALYDKEFSARPLILQGHQLRALSLKYQESVFTVSGEEFSARF